MLLKSDFDAQQTGLWTFNLFVILSVYLMQNFAPYNPAQNVARLLGWAILDSRSKNTISFWLGLGYILPKSNVIFSTPLKLKSFLFINLFWTKMSQWIKRLKRFSNVDPKTSEHYQINLDILFWVTNEHEWEQNSFQKCSQKRPGGCIHQYYCTNLTINFIQGLC